LYDDKHSQHEDRSVTMGLDGTGNLLVVNHTFREESEDRASIRIISARKATRNERTQYKEK
jgi:uncharacterized DUF497 family protein